MAPPQPPDPPQLSLTRRMAEDYGEDETVLVTRKNEFFVSSASGKRTLDMFTAEYKTRGYEDSNKRIKIVCREETDEYSRSPEASAVMKEQKRSLEASYNQGQGSHYPASSGGEHDGSNQGGPSSVGGSSQGNVNYANERGGYRSGARGGFSQEATSYKRGRGGRRNGGHGGFNHGNPNYTHVGRGGRSGFSQGSVGQGYNGGGGQSRQHESVEIERVVDTEDETPRDKPPFYLKVKYSDQEREDMKTATTSDSFYRIDAKTAKCANCGHIGHRLIDCVFPDRHGNLGGCPLCNDKSHDWCQCDNPHKNDLTWEDTYDMLVGDRGGKPGFRLPFPIIDMVDKMKDSPDYNAKYGLQGPFPLTAQFVRQMREGKIKNTRGDPIKIWETYDYISGEGPNTDKRKALISDPLTDTYARLNSNRIMLKDELTCPKDWAHPVAYFETDLADTSSTYGDYVFGFEATPQSATVLAPPPAVPDAASQGSDSGPARGIDASRHNPANQGTEMVFDKPTGFSTSVLNLNKASQGSGSVPARGVYASQHNPVNRDTPMVFDRPTGISAPVLNMNKASQGPEVFSSSPALNHGFRPSAPFQFHGSSNVAAPGQTGLDASAHNPANQGSAGFTEGSKISPEIDPKPSREDAFDIMDTSEELWDDEASPEENPSLPAEPHQEEGNLISSEPAASLAPSVPPAPLPPQEKVPFPQQEDGGVRPENIALPGGGEDEMF